MTAAENKSTALEFFDQAWVKADFDAYERYVDPGLVLHLAGYPEPFVGREAALEWVRAYHSAFPHIEFTVEAVLAEEDHVALRWHSEQRHEGVYLGVKPLGTVVKMDALQMFRLAGGKIVEVWIMFDPLNVMQQLGVLPAGLMPKPVLAIVNRVRKVRNRS